MKIKYVLAILCVFTLIISSAGVFALQTQEAKAEEKSMKVPLLSNGIFTAEIGIEKNKEPLYYLNGNYQKEDKIITCDGTVISREKEGVFTGTFKGYKKTYFVIIITIEEKKVIFEGSYKLDKNKEDFDGIWHNDEMEKCFEFIYPISYMMPDGTIITGNSEKEIIQLIKVWYEEYPDEKEKPVLQYPVDIKFKDGTIKTINNDEEMKAAYENCDFDKDWGLITGTFQGMDDSKSKNIQIILQRFPLLTKLLKRPVFMSFLGILLNR